MGQGSLRGKAPWMLLLLVCFLPAVAPGLSPGAMDTMKTATDMMNQCVGKGPHLKGISSSHILPLKSGHFSSC